MRVFPDNKIRSLPTFCLRSLAAEPYFFDSASFACFSSSSLFCLSSSFFAFSSSIFFLALISAWNKKKTRFKGHGHHDYHDALQQKQKKGCRSKQSASMMILKGWRHERQTNAWLQYSSKAGVTKLRPAGQIRPAKPFHPARVDNFPMRKNNTTKENLLIWQKHFLKQSHFVRCPALGLLSNSLCGPRTVE